MWERKRSFLEEAFCCNMMNRGNFKWQTVSLLEQTTHFIDDIIKGFHLNILN